MTTLSDPEAQAARDRRVRELLRAASSAFPGAPRAASTWLHEGHQALLGLSPAVAAWHSPLLAELAAQMLALDTRACSATALEGTLRHMPPTPGAAVPLLPPDLPEDLAAMNAAFTRSVEVSSEIASDVRRRAADLPAIAAIAQERATLMSTIAGVARERSTVADLFKAVSRRRDFESSLLSGISRALSRAVALQAGVQLWREDLRRFERVLIELGWPPPGLLRATLCDEIGRAYEAGDITQSEIEALFVQFYTRPRLDEMLAGWDEGAHAPHRLPILRAAIKAHVAGDYVLSVPTLLPQIEGIVADLFGHLGRMQKRDLMGYVGAMFTREQGFDAAGARFLLETVWDNFVWGQRVPLLSRHAILHGADTGYATPANSLRLILQIDQLLDAIRFVASRKGRSFHVAGCRALRRGAGRRIFRNRSEAAAAGLTPCARCLASLRTAS